MARAISAAMAAHSTSATSVPPIQARPFNNQTNQRAVGAPVRLFTASGEFSVGI